MTSQVIVFRVDFMYSHSMQDRSAREHVEVFHLLFLRLLTSAPDRANYRVKGGCNLRFWLNSVRYSEDIDIDVVVTAKQTLKNKIDRLLASAPFLALLQTQRLGIVVVSAPKQTETTQRWKVQLTAEGVAHHLHTKIEFSRRESSPGHAYEAVSAELARKYRVVAAMAHHYLADAATTQKIAALAGRVETQARDLFDLGLLFTSLGNAPLALKAELKKDMPTAIERAMSIGYDDYAGQVVAYLEEEHRPLYESRSAFEQLQDNVVSRLQELHK